MEIDQAKELVATAIKGLIKGGANIEDRIIVKAMDYDTSLQEQIEMAREQEAIDNRNKLFKTAGLALAALLILAIPGLMLLRNRKSVLEGSQAEVAISMMEELSDVEDIDLDDKNEIKKKIENFVTQKPEQVAQLLKTWLSEE